MKIINIIVELFLLESMLTVVTFAASSSFVKLKNDALPDVQFILFENQAANSQEASDKFCRNLSLMSVDATEVRYIWKQLPYNMSFYLGSKIEMTTDHPEIARGEVLCFPLRRQSGTSDSRRDALQTVLYWSTPGGAAGSCLFGVTSILCKRQLRSTTNRLATKNGTSIACSPIDLIDNQNLPKQQEQANTITSSSFKATEGAVCLSSPLFWTLTSGIGALLLSLATSTITLAVCSVRFRKRVNLGLIGNHSFGYRFLSSRETSGRSLMLQQAAAMMVAKQQQQQQQQQQYKNHIGGANLETDDASSGFCL